MAGLWPFVWGVSLLLLSPIARGANPALELTESQLLVNFPACRHNITCEQRLCTCMNKEMETRMVFDPSSGSTRAVGVCTASRSMCSVNTMCMKRYMDCWKQGPPKGEQCPASALRDWCCSYSTLSGCEGESDSICGASCPFRVRKGCAMAVVGSMDGRRSNCGGMKDCSRERHTSCGGVARCEKGHWECLKKVAQAKCDPNEFQSLCVAESLLHESGGVCTSRETDTRCRTQRLLIYDGTEPKKPPEPEGDAKPVASDPVNADDVEVDSSYDYDDNDRAVKADDSEEGEEGKKKKEGALKSSDAGTSKPMTEPVVLALAVIGGLLVLLMSSVLVVVCIICVRSSTKKEESGIEWEPRPGETGPGISQFISSTRPQIGSQTGMPGIQPMGGMGMGGGNGMMGGGMMGNDIGGMRI